MINNKKGAAWIWILIVLIVLIGIAAYFWLSSGDAGSVANAGTNAGSSIPQPPALPTG